MVLSVHIVLYYISIINNQSDSKLALERDAPNSFLKILCFWSKITTDKNLSLETYLKLTRILGVFSITTTPPMKILKGHKSKVVDLSMILYNFEWKTRTLLFYMKNMTACGSCHENISNLELASTKKKVSPLIEPFENLQRVILITMVTLDLCPFNFGLLTCPVTHHHPQSMRFWICGQIYWFQLVFSFN